MMQRSRFSAAWAAISRAQRAMLLMLAASIVLANLRQPYPEIAPIQHIPTVLILVAAPILLSRYPLSDRSVAALVAFFLLHTLAGRYTYSNVPYDDWARRLTGHDITRSIGLARNDFDRLVHFCFGLLWIEPFAEAMRRYVGTGWRTSVWIAFLFVGAVSAIYEVFEWLLTLVASPGMAADYNGQQGDAWDSQKDMAIAVVGALIACLALRRGPRHRN